MYISVMHEVRNDIYKHRTIIMAYLKIIYKFNSRIISLYGFYRGIFKRTLIKYEQM